MTDEPTPAEPPVTSGEVVSEPVTSGEWLAPPAAADRLGMSERTLWRLVKQGRYQKRVENRRAEILVPLPVTGAAEESRGNVSVVPVSQPDTVTLAVIAELRRQHDDATERLTRQAEQLGALRAERDALAEQLERAQRSWWRKLLDVIR